MNLDIFNATKDVTFSVKMDDPPAIKAKSEPKWTRKSVAIDDDIIEAMEEVSAKERKNFSQLAREAFLDLLKSRGVEL